MLHLVATLTSNCEMGLSANANEIEALDDIRDSLEQVTIGSSLIPSGEAPSEAARVRGISSSAEGARGRPADKTAPPEINLRGDGFVGFLLRILLVDVIEQCVD